MRRWTLAVAGVALLAGCGGGGSSPATPDPTPTPIPSAIVVLDSGNFDAVVLGPSKPSVVEFHSPT